MLKVYPALVARVSEAPPGQGYRMPRLPTTARLRYGLDATLSIAGLLAIDSRVREKRLPGLRSKIRPEFVVSYKKAKKKGTLKLRHSSDSTSTEGVGGVPS